MLGQIFLQVGVTRVFQTTIRQFIAKKKIKLIYSFISNNNFQLPMTDVNIQHSEDHYIIKTPQKPLGTVSTKQQVKEHCQQCHSAQKSTHLILSKKKSEGTISFGDLEHKESQELPTTAKKEIKVQQWEPRLSPQKIYFTYHSPQKIHDQPATHTQIHRSQHAHPFSLDLLRKKAGLTSSDSLKYYTLESRTHTVSPPAEDSGQSNDRVMSKFTTYQIGHRDCDICSRRNEQKHIIIENKFYQRNSSPLDNRNTVNKFVSAPIVQSRYIGTDAYTPSKIPSISQCKFQSEGKVCQLCSISRRSNIQRLKTLNIDRSYSKLSQEDQYNEVIEPESRASFINETQGRQSYQRYLTYTDAYQVSLNKSSSPLSRNQNRNSKTNYLLNPQKRKVTSSYISNRKEPRLCYSITKKDLEIIKRKEDDLHRQKLKTLSDSAEKKRCLTPTKTFQSQGIDPYAHRLKTYSEIHGFKTQPEGYSAYKAKQTKKDVDFGWVRRSLQDSAQKDPKIFRSRSKQLYSNHKSVRSCLRLYELQAEARRWYHANRRGIEYQSDLIFSYDLIRRSMTDDEIAERLQTYVVEMIDPKHWLSLMVNEVYDKFRVNSRQYRPY